MDSKSSWWTAKCQSSRLGPAWRWKQAQELVSTGYDCPLCVADPDLGSIVHYLKVCRQSTDQRLRARFAWPHIAAAIELGEHSTATDAIKLLLLADAPADEIIERCYLATETLAMWEKLFFDVRANLGSRGWIYQHVVRPVTERGATELAVKLKAALWGGLPAARAILDADQRVSLKSAERDYDLDLRMNLKMTQALDLPLNSARDALEFMKFHSKHTATMERLKLARERFVQQCQVAVERQRLAEQRRAERLENQRQPRLELDRRFEERAAARRARDERIQIDREVWHANQLANKLATLERAAASPLAQLTWGDGDAETVSDKAAVVENGAAGNNNPAGGMRRAGFADMIEQAIHDSPTSGPDADVLDSHEPEFEDLAVA